MSSIYNNDWVASKANDGDKSTFFTTGRSDIAWWAVDFGVKGTRVTEVRITNLDHFNYARLKSFKVGLTDLDPKIGNTPLKLPHLICATHGPLGRAETVSLTCTHPIYERRRYLFVYASVHSHFHLAEVEVFNSKLI
ncbi:hypothetical protein LSAT2_027732 [Lamellibrachia satsuma]|nr:hypothetical protein LSAT2_027732 [Lamellibrachia satsuma]